MNIIQRLADLSAEFTDIRRQLHRNPEIGFQEFQTAGAVAGLLERWGIAVERGVGGTGVVGTLRGTRGDGQTVGFRADMDALPIDEMTGVSYRSEKQGVFHGCGHDGHVAVLLATARYLSETRDFAGTVRFIFQPAEEGLGGARAMLADGLFDRFPCDTIFGFHNWPNLDLGKAIVLTGPVMAGGSFFDIALSGRGGHAAMPHQADDIVLCAAHLVTMLQSVVSRRLDPLNAGVVSITRFEAGSSYNVLPGRAQISGTVRFLAEEVRTEIFQSMERIIEGAADAFGVNAHVDIRDMFSVTSNAKAPSGVAAAAARRILGASNVDTEAPPSMGSEDFGDMLRKVPGAYILLGQGSSQPLHHPEYDFNDDLIPIAASVLASLAVGQPDQD